MQWNIAPPMDTPIGSQSWRPSWSGSGVDLIVVRGTPAAIAAKNANGTIPVVMASVREPLLVVASRARPGRNVTGLSAFVNVMTSKRLELIRELVPTISRIAVFANMSNAVAPQQWEETKTAARSLGIEAERGQPCELVHFCGRLTGRTGRHSGESLCPT
jgi:ABC-type uncharacterized transport system substrate-binding protein